MSIKYWQKQTVLCKVETTVGTDANPTPAANAIEVFDFSITPEADEQTRTPNRPFFSNDRKSFGNKRWSLSFTIDIAGAGNPRGTKPAIDPVLLACRHVGTSQVGLSYTYAPSSSATTTATIYFYLDGILHKALGCGGSIEFTAKIGETTKGAVSMMAEYVSPVDQAPTGIPDFSDFRTPVINSEANSELSIHGTLAHGTSFSLNQNNTNDFKESTETKFVAYTDRKTSASLEFWIQDIAEINPYALWEGEEGGVVYWQVGTTSGERVRFTMPNAQIGTPQPQDAGDIAGYSVEVTPHPTPTGEDDEYAIIFS